MKNAGKALLMVFAVAFGVLLFSGTSKAAMVATLNPIEVVTGNENVLAQMNTYEVPSTGDTVVPVTVSKPGELFIRIATSTVADTIRIGLYKDASGQYPAASSYNSYFIAQPNEVKTGSIPIGTAGTYYMIIRYSYGTKAAGSVSLSAYLASSEDRSLNNNTWSAFAPSYNSRYTYARVNITAGGYIGVVQANATGSGQTISLCDSSKNVIAGKSLAVNNVFYYPVSKGTYYLRTQGVYNAISQIKYVYTSGFSATQNKQTTIPLLGTCTYDVKIKAEKTGLLTLTSYNSNSFYVTFLNAKKSPISSNLWNWGSTSSVAVKKGQTYYFRMNASIGSGDRVFAYSISGAKTAKNTSKKKAMKLKKGKKKTLLITSGDKKWHYMKFSLSKKKKLNISFDTAGNGTYKYELLKGKRSFYVSNDKAKKKLTTTTKLSKGTYYFRIKLDNNSSAKFTFKLK